MPTEYHPFKVALSNDRIRSLSKAVRDGIPVTIRVKKDQLNKGDTLGLTARQINHLKCAASQGNEAEIKLTKTQLSRTKTMMGGSLLSTALTLARAAAPTVAKTLGMAGLSFRAEKIKINFGSGFGQREVELYNLVQKLTHAQKNHIEKDLVGRGFVRGGGPKQYGGFLGMLAAIGVPLAINLVNVWERNANTPAPAAFCFRKPPFPSLFGWRNSNAPTAFKC